MTEIIGIDHIYLTVSDLAIAERFYDQLFVTVLGFRKNSFTLGGDSHIQYYNRHFGYVLRPARESGTFNRYSPGLHHLCLRVETIDDVRECAEAMSAAGLEPVGPAHYPEYAPDYRAVYATDPDGMQIEITNFRQERRERYKKLQ
jgi:glyoxylase I family protein